jgi:hypothetical protein
VTLVWGDRDQPKRWHQALIGENADRRLLGCVELDAGR